MTTASAADAALGRNLTERGVAKRLILATGTGCPEAPLPDRARFADPRTTTAFYKSVRQASRIAEALTESGLRADTQVDVACDVSKAGELLWPAVPPGVV